MKNKRWLRVAVVYGSVFATLLITNWAFADFESSLTGIKNKLTGTILPVLSVIGMGLASLSLITGNPNAKQHVTFAILGAIFGFGAEAIVTYLSSVVR